MKVFAGVWGVLLPALAAAPSAEPADAAVVVDDQRASYELQRFLDVLPDPTGRRGIDEVAALRVPWGSAPALRRRRPGRCVYWARVRVQSQLGEAAEYVLAADRWERVDLYLRDARGEWAVQRSGWSVPLLARPVQSATPVLRLPLPAGLARTLYFRFESDMGDSVTPASFSVVLEPWTRFHGDDTRGRHLQGAYAGLILAVVLYNLLLYVSVRDRTYLLYVVYAGSFGLIWVAKSGLAFEVLWPELPRWHVVSPFYIIIAAVLSGNRFVRAFLDTQQLSPVLDRGLQWLSWGVCGALALRLLVHRYYSEQALAVLSLATCGAYVAAGCIGLRRGSPAARLYLAASGALIAGTVAYVLRFLEVIDGGFVAEHGPQIGSAVEVVTLAFAVRTRIALLRRGRQRAQALYRQGLEQRVRERTAALAREKAALEAAQREAEDANRRLQEVNARLARISYFDDLTAISNRRHFEMVFEAEWRRCLRIGQPLAAVLIDVDHFKAYNDHYGHLAGDRCLQRVAHALAAACPRAGDFLARFGGEEFVVLLPGTDEAGASVKAEELRLAVQRLQIPHAPPAETVVTISAGVGAGRPVMGELPASILIEADRALYAAKRRGRNQVMPPAAPKPAAELRGHGKHGA